MEQGCWCEPQGAYFANRKASKMVIPYGAVGAEWWDAHFLSLVTGFGKSCASAHLHVRTQELLPRKLDPETSISTPVPTASFIAVRIIHIPGISIHMPNVQSHVQREERQ